MQVRNVNGVQYDSNAYLIDARRKTLVDAGIDGKRVLESLPHGLDLIVLTHCHYDHVSAVPEIVAATGAQVAMHKADIPFLKSDKINCSSMFGSRLPALKIDIVLDDEEEIDLGDLVLKVIPTPGHTPGSICLYESGTKVLFTGDTVFDGGSFGRTDIGGSAEHMLSSLDKLTKMEVSAFYPGHGPAVTTGAKQALQQSYKNARHMLMI